jgi:hypothetical protein
MQSIHLRSVFLLFRLAATPLSAADLPVQSLQPDPINHGTFRVYFENDLFVGLADLEHSVLMPWANYRGAV